MNNRITKIIYNAISCIYDIILPPLFRAFGLNINNLRSEMVSKIGLINSNIYIIDLGCGTGENFMYIRKLYKKNPIIGVDISTGMLRKAKSKIKRHGIENVELIQSDFIDIEEKEVFNNLNYVVVSSFTMSIIWGNKLSRGAFLNIVKKSNKYSILDANWLGGLWHDNRTYIKYLGKIFGLSPKYWSKNTGLILEQYVKSTAVTDNSGMLNYIY